LLELLSIGFVGDVGDRVPEGDVGDLLEVESDSEMDPALFKIEGDLLDEVGVSATSEACSAIALGEDEVSAGTSVTSVVGMGSATIWGEDGVGVVSRDTGEVDLGEGTGVVRTRFPPSEITIKSLATVEPGIELLMAGLLHILQK
jgi:hypothetical protein